MLVEEGLLFITPRERHPMQTLTPVVPAAPLAVTRTADRSLTIHALGLDGPEKLGTSATTADAWRAIDALDMGYAGSDLARAA